MLNNNFVLQVVAIALVFNDVTVQYQVTDLPFMHYFSSDEIIKQFYESC